MRSHEVGSSSLDIDSVHGVRKLRHGNAEQDTGNCKNQHELWKRKGPPHGAA